MTQMNLKSLYRYPVKSLRGGAFDALDVTERGLCFDRHWMVVDAQGQFMTQRQHARMALIDTQVDDDGGLLLQAPRMPDLNVHGAHDATLPVVVWRDTVQAAPVDGDADAWLSEFLAIDCRLVVFPYDARRVVDPEYAAATDQVGFADGFPFLLISQASLDDLNARLTQPVPMLRFRPNLVIGGCDAYAEDTWRRIRVGDLEFRVAKPCSRCIIPTIDPATAQRSAEPLRTLMTYRRRDNRIYFGQNLIHDGNGRLAVGMPVEVLE